MIILKLKGWDYRILKNCQGKFPFDPKNLERVEKMFTHKYEEQDGGYLLLSKNIYVYRHREYANFSSVTFSGILNAFAITMQELLINFSKCLKEDHDYLLPYFHSNAGLLAEYNFLMDTTSDSTRREALAVKYSKLEATVKKGKYTG